MEKTKTKEYQRKYRELHKERLAAYKKEYAASHKEACAASKRDYYERNKDLCKARAKKHKKTLKGRLSNNKYRRGYYKRRLSIDPLFKLAHYLRSRLYQQLAKRGVYREATALKLIGITIAEYKAYIESKFTEGMSWDNYGKWHIDHIIPLASAKTPDEVYKLFHYTNTQPLWASDNIKKSDKVVY